MTKKFLQRAALGVVGAMMAAGPAPLMADEEEHASPEMRANWVARFHWARDTEEETRERITEIMRTLAEANFNTVLFQVRGEANTLYPSPYEPWGPQFDWTNPGWDPLEFAIEEARAYGLEFHVYFNTHTMAAARTLPPADTEPQHIYNLHGPDAEDSWVIHNEEGEAVATTDSYVWLSPGHPDASAWVRRTLMHIVDNYDIDGVHFDRIRTPSGNFSHDPRTLERFAGDGNPDNEEWGDFMRAQITRDLRRIYGDIALRKPHIKISAAPFGIVKRVEGGYQGTGTESYHAWRQDTFTWMESGVLDAIFPMIYWEMGSAHPFEVLLGDFLNRTGGRHVYPGIHNLRGPLDQIEEARRQGAPGNTLWSYVTTEFDALLEGPYAKPAPVPEMEWKTDPKTGIIAGTITNESGDPLVDAWVWVRGDDYTYLSGGDGFYSILNLEPGTHTITVRKNGIGETVRTVAVDAGEALRLDIVIPDTESQATALIDRAVEMTENGATRLRPQYVRKTLVSRAAHKDVNEAFQAALDNGSEDSMRDLIRAVELRFVFDPRTSTLDLIPDQELARHYRNFDWHFADYPGGPEGPNEDLAREMVAALNEVRPERRVNSRDVSVILRDEATEEIWDYMEAEWETIPGEERYMLNRHAVESYVAMREQAAKEGIELVVRSAHRTRQRAEAGAARANNPMAVASFSAHSLGLAIDFQLSQGDFQTREITTRPMSAVIRMRESPVHKWIFLRADEFGWYPYQHEPWHWEYNPDDEFRNRYFENFPDGAPPRDEE